MHHLDVTLVALLHSTSVLLLRIPESGEISHRQQIQVSLNLLAQHLCEKINFHLIP